MKTKAEEWLKNNCKPEDWNNIEEDLADTMLTNNVIKYMESYARPTIEGKEEQAEWEFLTIIKANYEIAKRAEESDFAGMTKKEAVLELYDDLISIIERLPLKRPPLSQPSGTGKEELHCGVCGSQLVSIRGEYPGTEKRNVCPTCTTERLEHINKISSREYGKAYKHEPIPIISPSPQKQDK